MVPVHFTVWFLRQHAAPSWTSIERKASYYGNLAYIFDHEVLVGGRGRWLALVGAEEEAVHLIEKWVCIFEIWGFATGR